jgi:hypothetical protein
MKLRVEVVVEDDTGREMKRVAVMEQHCGAQNSLAGGLSLSMGDSKSLLGSIQQHFLEVQVQSVSCEHAHCSKCTAPMKRKDTHTVVYRTLFGKFTLLNARFFACDCCENQGKKSYSPLSAILTTHTHPELLYVQSRWAALIPYGQSLRLLQDVLPLEGAVSLTNMKVKVSQVGQRIEADRAKQARAMVVLDESTQTATSGEEQTPTSLSVGVDAGYIRSNAAKGEGSRRFGVIAVKTVETNSRCYAYVQTKVDDGSERISNFVEQGRDAPPTNVTFFTDAGADIKAATPLVGKASQRILDWFHFAMYFQIALQTATPFKRWQYNATRTIFEGIERVKWRLWHGQVDAACQRLRLLATWIGSQANTKLKAKLTNRLFELLHYAEENVDYLVNYARRHRDKLPISSAMAESVVNQVISRRFVKKQQMRWSPQGAHHLVQVRTAVLNDELAEHFKRWHPGFATNDLVYARAA